jgi:thiosulfate/3-mercaptopyruvate sulfurtransferase
MISLKKAVSVIAVAVLAGSLATPAANSAPKNQARAVVQADWLEKNIDDPKVRIIEVSTEAGLYERGHIKNAFKINWYTDLVDTVKRDIVPIG